MKLQLHHIEMCVQDLSRTVQILEKQFGFQVVGVRKTLTCEQIVVQTFRTVFVINCRVEFRKGATPAAESNNNNNNNESSENGREREPWIVFCCDLTTARHRHIDSVFNIAIQVEDLSSCLEKLKSMKCQFLHEVTSIKNEDGSVDYAIVKSQCGNVLHTLIEKRNYGGWFLPGFKQLPCSPKVAGPLPTHFDHVALACHVGQTNEIIKWYEEAFGMRRFLTNKQDTNDEGLVIDGDVGMRLKVMEFWKCSETGIEPQTQMDATKEPLKIVVVESLENIKNTQVENFLTDHIGPGIQHIGLHTDNITEAVDQLIKQGVQFRYPPPTYYTEIGQLEAIRSVGEDVDLLRAYGILLDSEADTDEAESQPTENRYLMQVFTYPVFEGDTFFLEIIQRKGARGFGVGNVTALARSVNASNNNKLLKRSKSPTTATTS